MTCFHLHLHDFHCGAESRTRRGLQLAGAQSGSPRPGLWAAQLPPPFPGTAGRPRNRTVTYSRRDPQGRGDTAAAPEKAAIDCGPNTLGATGPRWLLPELRRPPPGSRPPIRAREGQRLRPGTTAQESASVLSPSPLSATPSPSVPPPPAVQPELSGPRPLPLPAADRKGGAGGVSAHGPHPPAEAGRTYAAAPSGAVTAGGRGPPALSCQCTGRALPGPRPQVALSRAVAPHVLGCPADLPGRDSQAPPRFVSPPRRPRRCSLSSATPVRPGSAAGLRPDQGLARGGCSVNARHA